MAHYGKSSANPEDDRDERGEHEEHDERNNAISPAPSGGILTLDTLMSALRLVMDQQAAEASLRGVSRRPDVVGDSTSGRTADASTSTLAMPSPALSASNAFTEVSNPRATVEAAPQPIPQPIAPVVQPSQPAPRWYCVTRGHAVGVFVSWANVSPLVTGVPGSIYQRHANFGAALAAFLEAAGNGTVLIISSV